MKIYIGYDCVPFYRNWLGWRKLFWFLNPIRWYMTREYSDFENGSIVSETDYFLTKEDALKAKEEFING